MQCQLWSPTRFCSRTTAISISLYLNDLPYVSKFEGTLFADDTNLHLSHNNIKSLQIQTANEVDKINNWINANKLTINYKKSCFMLVGNKQAEESDFNLRKNHIKIEQSDHVKYLNWRSP